MAGDLSTGLGARIAQWKAQLWQVFEGQYEPYSIDVVQRYLRGLLAYFRLARLDDLCTQTAQLSRRLALPDPPDQDSIDTAVRRILSSLEVLAGTVEDPPPRKAHIIHIAPGPEFLQTSLDLSLVFDQLEKLGTLEVYPDITACPLWEQFDPQRCTMRWDLVLITNHETERIHDALDFLASEPGMKISLEEAVSTERLQEIHLGNAVAPIPDNPAPGPGNPAGYQRRASDRDKPGAAPHAQDRRAEGSSIRMSTERLDKIINSVGELVTAQSRLKQIADRLKDHGLEAVAEDIERQTVTLRDASMRLRMQPVGALFTRFTRLVRDLSGALGKDVEFSTEGEETEIDRTILEKLYDPLVHLVRNSLDHGIEAPELRARAGKPQRGSIHMQAYQLGSEVIIKIQDDGGGIDRQKVLAKGIEKGLVRSDANLDDHQILDLIFMPGFSTAAVVTDVSGRGVGMDVVKSNVEALRGQVEIESEMGVGTTMILHFPLTMAIIDGLEIMVGGDKYILPLEPVEECLDLVRYEDGGKLLDEFSSGKQGLIYNLRDEGISLFSLSAILCPQSPPGTRIIIVHNARGDRLALGVDSIVGRLQVVIKPLGPLHVLRKELSGATVLGDGSVALVLDLPNVIRRLTTESSSGKNIALC